MLVATLVACLKISTFVYVCTWKLAINHFSSVWIICLEYLSLYYSAMHYNTETNISMKKSINAYKTGAKIYIFDDSLYFFYTNKFPKDTGSLHTSEWKRSI